MVEQNARSRYAMATLVVARDWGDLFLQSSNAIVGHRLFERFDASRPGDPPRVLDQHNRTRMLVSETRLSRPFNDGLGWVVGASIVDHRTRQRPESGAASSQRSAESAVGQACGGACRAGWVRSHEKNTNTKTR